jgi:flagellar basal body-associated protein FliL
MSWIDIISLVLNVLLSGSLIVTLFTLKSAKRKAKEEAEGLRIQNDRKVLQDFKEFIVNPLKADLVNLKKELSSYKQELSKFRKAIERIEVCEHKEGCPVRCELQKKDESPLPPA